MARRDIIVPPFYAPGGQSLCTVEVQFVLVDGDHRPIAAIRSIDEEGIACRHLIVTSDLDQIVALTPQEEIYGYSAWRVRIALEAGKSLDLRTTQYSEYFVTLPAGDGSSMPLSEFLSLALGTPPDNGGNVGLHAQLPDTDTDGHPGSVIVVAGGVTGNAVGIGANGELVDAGTPPGGSGTTNLGVGTRTGTTLEITSSSGQNVTVPEASGTEAGLMAASSQVTVSALDTAAFTPATDYATAAQGANADTAFGWNDHALAGYLTTVAWGDVTSKPSTFPPEAHDSDHDTHNDARYAPVAHSTGAGNGADAHVTAAQKTDWNEAHGWGDHAQVGYLTTVAWGDVTGKPSTFPPEAHDLDHNVHNDARYAPIAHSTGAGNGPDVHVTAGQKVNWNSAFSWGNHALAGYLTTAHPAANVKDDGSTTEFLSGAGTYQTPAGGSDELVAVSATDTTPSFLQSKLTSGDASVTFSRTSPGGNEQLDIRATGAGGGEANAGVNLGIGSEVYAGMNGVNLEFRTIDDSSNIVWTQTANLLTAEVPADTFDPFGLASTVQGNLDFHTGDATTHFTQGAISIPASQISDFDTEVANNTTVAAHTSKLAGIEDNATADQTAAEIKTAYESNADTNEFSDVEKLKLSTVENGATIDQSPAEIKTAYESNPNTNAFTDAEQTKVSNALTSTGSIDTHTDVDTTTAVPTSGQVLEWDGSNWVPATPGSGVTDHTLLSNIGTNTHAQIDTHIADATTHFTQGAISITASQVSDFAASVAGNAAVTTNTAKVSADGSIDTHSDVDTTTAAPSTGDHLEWSGSAWTPGTPSDDVTLVTTSHDYLSLSGQAITLGAIDLAADVTGDLPAANVAFGTGTDSYVWTSDGAGGAAWEASPAGGTWTNGTTITYWGLTSQTPSYSATITINLDLGQQVVYVMSGNSTITLSSTMTNTQATFILVTSGFTPTWAAAMNVGEPEGGHDWSAAADNTYLVHVVKQGSNWYIAETPMQLPS